MVMRNISMDIQNLYSIRSTVMVRRTCSIELYREKVEWNRKGLPMDLKDYGGFPIPHRNCTGRILVMKGVNNITALGFGGRKPITKGTLYVNKRRRRVLPGFPWDGKFTTMDEVNDYIAHDRFTCLLCGRTFKSFSSHLSKIHGTEIHAYKEQFGIPESVKMLAPDLKEHRSKLGKERFESDPKLREMLLGNSNPTGTRSRSETVASKNERKEKLKGNTYAKLYHNDTWSKILDGLRQGRSLRAILSEENMPVFGSVKLHATKDPEFDKEYRRLMNEFKEVHKGGRRRK